MTLLIATALTPKSSLLAAELYWSGAGTWNTADTSWGTATGGPYNTAAWSNSTPDSAIFEGTPGIVSLGEPISASGLSFAVDGYSVTGNTLTLSGSTSVSAGTATIGSAIAGSLTKDGAGILSLTGTNNSNGGMLVNAGRLNAANLGTGALTVNAGATVSWTNSGYAAFSPSAITLAGGTLSIDGTTQNAHNFVNKTITLSGGTLTSINGPAGPANDGGYGNFILNNSTLVVNGTAQSLISTSTLQTSGANAIFNVGETGQDVDLRVTAAVTGTGALQKSGSGTMELTRSNTFSGGTVVNAGTLKFSAISALSSGAITINGGTLEIATTIFNAFGSTPNALTIEAGGTLRAANTVNNAHGIGVLTLNGGTLASNNVGSAFGNFVVKDVITGGISRSTISAGSITINAASTFTVNDAVVGTDLLVSSNILSGTLNKAGAGTMELTGTNTYTGATTVSAGTLLVSGSLGNSAVTVNGGAFGGTGAIGSTLNLLSGSFHVVDFSDALSVTSTVSLYAGFGVDDLAGITWGNVADGTYTLIDGTLSSGVFAALANNSLATAYDIGSGRSAYFQENSLQVIVIPEPSTLALFATAIAAGLLRRRARD